MALITSDCARSGHADYGSQLLDFVNIRLYNPDAAATEGAYPAYPPVDWAAADIHALSSPEAYDASIRAHIQGSEMVECIDALWETAGRRTLLTAVLPCAGDDDRTCWDGVMLGRFDLYGLGL